jgi:hypothetical protein
MAEEDNSSDKEQWCQGGTKTRQGNKPCTLHATGKAMIVIWITTTWSLLKYEAEDILKIQDAFEASETSNQGGDRIVKLQNLANWLHLPPASRL